jgi:hypothetical protein
MVNYVVDLRSAGVFPDSVNDNFSNYKTIYDNIHSNVLSGANTYIDTSTVNLETNLNSINSFLVSNLAEDSALFTNLGNFRGNELSNIMLLMNEIYNNYFFIMDDNGRSCDFYLSGLDFEDLSPVSSSQRLYRNSRFGHIMSNDDLMSINSFSTKITEASVSVNLDSIIGKISDPNIISTAKNIETLSLSYNRYLLLTVGEIKVVSLSISCLFLVIILFQIFVFILFDLPDLLNTANSVVEDGKNMLDRFGKYLGNTYVYARSLFLFVSVIFVIILLLSIVIYVIRL